MSRANFFVRHSPSGFKVHLELDLQAGESGKLPMSLIPQTISWLVDNDFEPDAIRSSETRDEPASDVPACPECGGDMYDNRPQKKSGEFKPNSPDFKCKNKDCNKAIWPKREGK